MAKINLIIPKGMKFIRSGKIGLSKFDTNINETAHFTVPQYVNNHIPYAHINLVIMVSSWINDCIKSVCNVQYQIKKYI